MKTETVGALLFRLLGAVLLLLGTVAILGVVVSYFYIATAVVSHDTYYVVGESLVWSGVLVATGVLFMIFSNTLGRLLVKGLPWRRHRVRARR